MSTQAGSDIVLIYGSTDDATLELAAAAVADQIIALREEAPPEGTP